MQRVAVGFGMWLVLGSAWAQQVWKCEVDGQVRYTDQPCEKSGQPLPARSLRANVVDSLATEAARAAPSASSVAAVPAASAASVAVVDTPASAPQAAASAVGQPVIARQHLAGGSGRRGTHEPLVAQQGLMQTDFVQRGRAPRRQNPASSPLP